MRLSQRISARLHSSDRALAFLGFAFLLVGMGMGYVQGYRAIPDYILICSVPALSSLLLLVLCALFPGIASEEGYARPMNVTLPLIYGLCVWTVGILTVTPPTAIVAVRPELAPLTIWQNAWMVIGCTAICVALLTPSAKREGGR